MTLAEAMALVSAYGRATRPSWGGFYLALRMSDGVLRHWYAGTDQHPPLLDRDDLAADDWQEVERPTGHPSDTIVEVSL